MKTSYSAPSWARVVLNRSIPKRRRLAAFIKTVEGKSLGLQGTHEEISNRINSRVPFLVGRPGGTESEGLSHFLRRRISNPSFDKKPKYPQFFLRNATTLSGITYASQEDLDVFCLEYFRSMLGSDILVVGSFAPGIIGFASSFYSSGRTLALSSQVEPLLALGAGVTPWTQALQGKKVLIIHPFAESIVKQYSKRREIQALDLLLPEFDLQVHIPPVLFAGSASGENWFETLQFEKEQISKLDFEIAIIGAGGFGLPLGNFVREIGKQAIHLGGSVQLLFGIRGRRWDSDPRFNAWIDPSWVRPLSTETPSQSRLVENSAYW
jgi:hypothetical protein